MNRSNDSPLSSSSPPPSPPRDGRNGFCLKRRHDRFVIGARQRVVSERWVADSVQKVRLWLETLDTAEEATRTSAVSHLPDTTQPTKPDLLYASINFKAPEESSRATYNLEPFSFEEACRIEEEGDSFVGALRAKLFTAKTNNRHSNSSALRGSHCRPSRHQTTTRNKNTRAAPSQQSLHQLHSPPPPRGSRISSEDSSSTITT